MTAQLIDGNALAQTHPRRGGARAPRRSRARGSPPGLAVILVGDDPASQVYVRNKVKACEDSGHALGARDATTPTLTEAELLARIARAERRPGDPRHPGAAAAAARTSTRTRSSRRSSPPKDVDGFPVANAGALMTGLPRLRPARPTAA